MNFSLLTDIFKKNYKVDIPSLPSQGYFYPDNTEIIVSKGNIDDQIKYHQGINNTNIFGIIDTVKSILKDRLSFKPSSFKFNDIRAIDIFYIFIEFVKYTNDERIYFNGIEFTSNNFIYFDYYKYINDYDSDSREFIYDGWRFSLPSIGVETSLSRFAYELTINGKSEDYQNSNYNLMYFLGKKSEVSYDEIVNLIEVFDDLDEPQQNELNEIVFRFAKSGLYFLMEEGKKSTRINPNMLKNIWSID